MKKILFFLLAVLLSFPVFARDFEYTYKDQTLTYTVLDEDAKTVETKSGYFPSAGNNVSGVLEIPSKVSYGNEIFTVTSIGDYAFLDCSGLTSVTIPESVTAIGDYAFGWSGLNSVTIPESVTRIGDCAFVECSGLIRAEFASVESLCSIRFYNIWATPLSYAKKLFIGGKEIKELIIPESVTSIGDYVVYGCSGLPSVTIPEAVTS
ncbi:MAG: leucine-rich repeat domain-containing protein, partial [Muribaculaceae bacterium]|nr:leucine-rich repeat domain-containing protein [Muribaculaceae bacterium]